MPISDKNLGKYKRPDIYIEEIDASVIELPIQDVLINLVPGFSKKGPVNTPVLVNNKTDFIKIFGDIDKSLERKGSYFHRTCIKMLESGPVYALNLLLTDDERDTLKWKSVSLATQYTNSTVNDMPFSKIYNRQDFWKKDAESFLDYTEIAYGAPDNDRLLHITNVGDKTTTTFVYKSAAKGFDVSADEWYGGADKVPAYIHPKDWISDYMVTVVVLSGDWTNYNTLVKDNTLGKYFTSEGLVKGTISSFLNERTVNVLAYYDASLIPYFKDLNNRNMYIKTIINNDTDKTGLFCTYNEDALLDSDVPVSNVDIIGASIVGENVDTIEFMSYKETIKENVTYPIVSLDSYGNSFNNNTSGTTSTDYVAGTSRTSKYMNGYFEGISAPASGSTLTKVSGIRYNGTNLSYYVYGFGYNSATSTYTPSSADSTDQQQEFAVNDIVYFTQSYDSIVAGKLYYVTAVQDGGRAVVISETLGGTKIAFTQDFSTATLQSSGLYMQRATATFTLTSNNYFMLDDNKYSISTSNNKVVFEPLELTISNTSVTYAERYDVLYMTKGSSSVQVLKGTQSSTTASKPTFGLDVNENIILGYYKMNTRSSSITYPNLKYVIDMTYTPVSLASYGYATFYATNFAITTSTEGTNNVLYLTFTTAGSTVTSDYNICRNRQIFNEISTKLLNGKSVAISKADGSKFSITASNVTVTDYGVTTNGVIKINFGTTSTGNYYQSIGSGASQFYKVLFYFLDNEFYMIQASTNTNRLISSSLPAVSLAGSGNTTGNAGVIGQYSDLYIDFYNGIINNNDYIYVNNSTGSTYKMYLKMWTSGSTVTMDFVASDGVSPMAIDEIVTNYNSQVIIYSSKSNFKQTVEIESFDSTNGMNNIYQISINKTRYSEIVRGSFIEGYNTGEDGYRKLVRVIKSVQDPNNANNKLVTTDGPVAVNQIYSSVADYYTTVYPQIDTYVSTYKGISLAPFKVSNESVPNKTESRQSDILDLVGKTTNLAKGLANKNKIQWRYLVDSFGLGLTAYSKQQLADLCGLKLNCLGFINMPSVKMLKKSDNPSFTNSDGSLNTEFLKNGGDESKSPSFLYSFAEGVGATCVGYMFPYVQVDDDGTPLDMPPAAHAATTYMKKFLTTQTGIEPWTIPAGVTNGRVTGIGDVEMDFTNDDLDNLAAMGANPIVKKLNAGFCINTEYTAKIFPYSSLSLMHSREVLIELENSMYDMLLRYQWKFNTTDVRAEVKYKADKICKDIQTRNGLYDYTNIMDESNNTNYIIDLQMGVLDTYIEIIKGMGVIVNNITILKKGDIQSSGFGTK